jgi:putative addiction module killer protein
MFIIQKTEQFDHWILKLKDIKAKGKILARIKKAEIGNLGDHKNVGCDLSEMRIDYGLGYRIYFCRLKGTIILLLWGGDKSSQSRDIKKAQQIAFNIGV